MIKHYKAATGNKMDKHRGMEGVQIQTHDTLSASNTTKTSCTETVSQRQHATNFLLLFGRHERCVCHKYFH